MTARRFPPPCSVEVTDACYIVRDGRVRLLHTQGQQLRKPLSPDRRSGDLSTSPFLQDDGGPERLQGAGFRRNRQRQSSVPAIAVRRLPMMNFPEDERVSSAWAKLTITLMVAYATIVVMVGAAILHS
jgi:hypothetical protein